MNDKLRQLLKVTRVQTAFVTMLALWVGYISVRPLTVWPTVTLGAIGLFIHIWGFTHNELRDAEYDEESGAEGHPIASGEISKLTAFYISNVSLLIALCISYITLGAKSLLIICLSFIPGFMYNIYSKKHWWSNMYLSIWAGMLVVAGAYYAGKPTGSTILLGIAISIQIFVQVMQGDLKDLAGDENTFIGKLGVCLDITSEKVMNRSRLEIFVTTMKLSEFVLVSAAALISLREGFWTGLLLFVPAGGLFLFTHNIWIVKDYNRGRIKKLSSFHELSSIVFLGVSLTFIHILSGVLIMLMPAFWYVSVNNLIHSGPLNPDI